MLNAIGQDLETRERRRIDAYLAGSTDLTDLERRLQAVERNGCGPTWFRRTRTSRRHRHHATPGRRPAAASAASEVARAPSLAFRTLREAVRQKRTLHVVYRGHYRVLCPHAVGWGKAGEEVALMYQFAGGSTRGLSTVGSAGNWRHVRVAGLVILGMESGVWHTCADNAPAADELVVTDTQATPVCIAGHA